MDLSRRDVQRRGEQQATGGRRNVRGQDAHEVDADDLMLWGRDWCHHA
jgi:hypothetical protein